MDSNRLGTMPSFPNEARVASSSCCWRQPRRWRGSHDQQRICLAFTNTHTHTLTHTHKDLAWILCVNVLDENRCWTSSIRICDAPSCGVADALRGVLFGSSGKMQGHPIPPVYLHHSLVSVFFVCEPILYLKGRYRSFLT